MEEIGRTYLLSTDEDHEDLVRVLAARGIKYDSQSRDFYSGDPDNIVARLDDTSSIVVNVEGEKGKDLARFLSELKL